MYTAVMTSTSGRFLSQVELVTAIAVGIVSCVAFGGWAAFKADDNNLLQGIDSEKERQAVLVERQNELITAFILNGIPPALLACFALAMVLRQLRLRKSKIASRRFSRIQ